MKLISCDNCGLLYDQDKMKFPEIEDDSGNIDNNAVWNGIDYAPFLNCKGCGAKIPKIK